MEDLEGFARLARAVVLADEVMERATKETVVEAARILAAELAHYKLKFGKTAIDKTAMLVDFNHLTEDQAEWMSESLENLVVALVTVREGEGGAQSVLQ
ncbi:MAG: hypothetical protein ACREUW_08210 [Burkholderiales bacterium]